MTKDATLILRVNRETKLRIAEAARRRGKSMSSFIMDAAEAEARRVEARPPSDQGDSGARPAFFRALCLTASQGGANGYFEAKSANAPFVNGITMNI